MKYTPKVGAFVLETLTTGMYVNPLDAIREYIQNASDAIISAQKFKMLKNNAGLVIVSLDPSAKTLTVRDNGTGILSSDAIEKLLNIGMSAKIYGEQAGFRGIGRLAGIAYCKRLEFRTTFAHEDEMTSITFDCDSIRESIRPSMKAVEELTDVLQKHTTQDLGEAKKDDHFFEVKMQGIDSRLMQFLNMEEMEVYLSQVAPVEFDAQRFLYATKIEKWADERGLRIPTVKVLIRSLDAEREVFKPYKTHYKTKQNNFDIHVKDIRFFPEDADEKSSFWMWYAATDLLGMFDDDRVAGLRFRKDNIAIGGPGRVAELFPGNEGRLNNWTMGEIHIRNDDIIPNARRDGFEATPEWLKVRSGLEPFIKQHCKACHDAAGSATRPTAKVVSSAKAVAETTKAALKAGLASNDERQELIGKIDREADRVESSLRTRQTESERQELQSVLTSLKAVRENLGEKDVFAASKLKSNLDRKERRIISDILELLREVLDLDQFERARKAIVAKYGFKSVAPEWKQRSDIKQKGRKA
jgi:molecular chaperone HtpG